MTTWPKAGRNGRRPIQFFTKLALIFFAWILFFIPTTNVMTMICKVLLMFGHFISLPDRVSLYLVGNLVNLNHQSMSSRHVGASYSSEHYEEWMKIFSSCLRRPHQSHLDNGFYDHSKVTYILKCTHRHTETLCLKPIRLLVGRSVLSDPWEKKDP